MDKEDNKTKPGGKILFQAGNKANPNGRPKGSPNKITSQMRETFINLYDDNKHRMQEDLDELDAKDRLKFWVDMAPYFMPKLVATKAELTVRHTGAEQISSAELTQFILEIQSNQEDGE